VDIRQAIHHEQAETLDTDGLRRHFVVETLFVPGTLTAVYSHYDRMVLLGIVPTTAPLEFGPDLAEAAGVDDFLARREIGFVHLGGGPALIGADGATHRLELCDVLYLGMGTRAVSFAAAEAADPPRLYGVSTPAHARHPTRLVRPEEASPQHLGAVETSNKRTIYKYIHPGLMPSCQLVLGLTRLDPGSVWNTMPAHTHDRRMEAYLYFEMPADRLVMHLMGRPEATRHLILRNEQAVISPPWSVHAGAGTGSYAFVWAMAGDNQAFADMDFVPMEALR
jgi:4-deoxy-L-threo-5-hexosulose-uronate ketol-isomerase